MFNPMSYFSLQGFDFNVEHKQAGKVAQNTKCRIRYLSRLFGDVQAENPKKAQKTNPFVLPWQPAIASLFVGMFRTTGSRTACQRHKRVRYTVNALNFVDFTLQVFYDRVSVAFLSHFLRPDFFFVF